MPDIQAAYEQLAPKGLTLLAISVDESALDAAAFAALNNATFTILSDPNRLGTGASYPIFNFPTHLFIDRDGMVRSIVLANMDVETAIAQGEAVL
jgi:peroxiredoxin